MLDAAIYQLLAGNSAVAGMVGTRIYPSRAPDEATLPYLVYLDMAEIDRARDLDGVGGLRQARVQVDAWASTATGAKRLGDAVVEALEDFTGAIAGVTIADVELIGGFDDWDGGEGAAPSPVYRRMREFYVWVQS
ncbi:DUF3168 domain-containing protein [Pedomonas sp. V897]|uniref:DUF3168 domain-containing protein n=1 Tax=Pedomonas sp. V897 TaxID=3446482 RepID=UPI003EDF9624